MNLPLSKIGLDSDKNTIILNLRIEEKDRIDNLHIFPAYHMNKEHWNTIIINRNVDKDLVKELVQLSYELTIK